MPTDTDNTSDGWDAVAHVGQKENRRARLVRYRDSLKSRLSACCTRWGGLLAFTVFIIVVMLVGLACQDYFAMKSGGHPNSRRSIFSSTGLPWTNHRYAYQAVHDSRGDAAVPLTEYLVNGNIVTSRFKHNHHRPVFGGNARRDIAAADIAATTSPHTHHSPGAVIHNIGDLIDILFSEEHDVSKRNSPVGSNTVHVEVETRTIPYSTDLNGQIYYGPNAISVYHTHMDGGPAPMVPNINPTMANGDRDPTAHTGATSLSARPSSALPSQTNEPAIAPASYQSLETGAVGDLQPDQMHSSSPVAIIEDSQLAGFLFTPTSTREWTTVTRTNSSNTGLMSTHDGDAQSHITPPPITSSVIFDDFWSHSVTVTYAGSGTWKMIPWSTPEAPAPPTGTPVGPVRTIFDPVVNITYEVAPYDSEDSVNSVALYWRPISTGTPTRPEDIAAASSFIAAGGKPPSMPKPHIVFDSRTNITWNQTFEGDVINWIPVYIAVSTGDRPDYTHPPVPWIPEWPGFGDEEDYNPGANWVVGGHLQGQDDNEARDLPTPAETPLAGSLIPAAGDDNVVGFPEFDD
ncbi:hypothetical protein DRE_04016 [Drechslerella stenobrocha 248]|uniref:Uncharacterized protein n=1 Tax=Drechslerella stenobrocha 248 TaxID=1043628 RepID=W7HRT6_9PEZI|nr:hypothetical protein DRE_04016 [Drechslerella stenobrocha 248]